MARLKALLDSNVVVAGLVEGHSHHSASVAILMTARESRFAVAAHSYAEVFSTLTKRGGPAPYAWDAARAWDAIESVGAVTTLVGLTPAQTANAVRQFAHRGGLGAQIYDWLIGQAAIESGIERIITWNVSHFRPLFPHLDVLTPDQALA